MYGISIPALLQLQLFWWEHILVQFVVSYPDTGSCECECASVFCKKTKQKTDKHDRIRRRSSAWRFMLWFYTGTKALKECSWILFIMIHGFMSTAANTNTKPDAPISCSTIIYLWMNILQLHSYVLGLREMVHLLSSVWDSLLPVRSLKVTLYHAVSFPFLFTSQTICKNRLPPTSAGGGACGGTKVPISVFTCIVKTATWQYLLGTQMLFMAYEGSGAQVSRKSDLKK